MSIKKMTQVSKFVEKLILCGYHVKRLRYIYLYIHTHNTKVMRVFIGIRMLTDLVTWYNPIIPFFQDTVVCLL